MLKAVLFDLDGTLVKGEHIGPEIYAEMFPGRDVVLFESVWRRQLQAPTLKQLLGDELDAFYYRYQKRIGEEPEVPGFAELMNLLKEQGIRTALVTHARSQDLINQLELRDWDFDCLVPFELMSEPKPSPLGYEYAMKNLLGVSPDDCVVVEDSEYGVAAGRAAGCRTVHIHCYGDCAIEAFHHCEDMRELTAMLMVMATV